MPNSRAAEWQERIDADFPHGLLAHWDTEDSDATYRCPNVEVLGMKSQNVPEVRLAPFDVDKTVVLTILSYEEEQQDPRVVRVTTPVGDMLWSGNISASLQRQMGTP